MGKLNSTQTLKILLEDTITLKSLEDKYTDLSNKEAELAYQIRHNADNISITGSVSGNVYSAYNIQSLKKKYADIKSQKDLTKGFIDVMKKRDSANQGGSSWFTGSNLLKGSMIVGGIVLGGGALLLVITEVYKKFRKDGESIKDAKEKAARVIKQAGNKAVQILKTDKNKEKVKSRIDKIVSRLKK